MNVHAAELQEERRARSEAAQAAVSAAAVVEAAEKKAKAIAQRMQSEIDLGSIAEEMRAIVRSERRATARGGAGVLGRVAPGANGRQCTRGSVQRARDHGVRR